MRFYVSISLLNRQKPDLSGEDSFMKKKSNAFLCILMCVVLMASLFVACDSKDKDGDKTSANQGGTIIHEVPPEPSYSKVFIADVELAEILEEERLKDWRQAGIG